MVNAKISYILKGFSQVTEFRVFEFEGVAIGSARTLFTVRIDLALARKYGIRLQELPLLCRGFLDQCSDNEEKRDFTYTEQLMSSYVDQRLGQPASERYKKSPWAPGADYLARTSQHPSR
jgi:hypothetical protein